MIESALHIAQLSVEGFAIGSVAINKEPCNNYTAPI